MRKSLIAAALLLVLSYPAFAGELHTPGTPEPPPKEIVYTPGETETPLESPTTGEVNTSGASEDLTLFALDLLAFLPSLL